MVPEDFFTLLSDETRLRCLLLLWKKKEICVCEFCHILNCGQPKISRHLAQLRQSGLVHDERRGQWVYYQLNKSMQPWIRKQLRTAFADLGEMEPYCSDSKKMYALGEENPCTKKTNLKG